MMRGGGVVGLPGGEGEVKAAAELVEKMNNLNEKKNCYSAHSKL